MGHLTHVADECLKLFEKCATDLPPSTLAHFTSDPWLAYADGTLRETRERDRAQLGGVRPDPRAIGLGMGEEGGVTVAFGNATLEPGVGGEVRGWMGEVGVGGDEEDDEEEGGASKVCSTRVLLFDGSFN